MYAIAILKCAVGSKATYYVLAHKDERAVLAFETAEKGLAYFSDAYASAHARGAGFSAGATIAWLQTAPRVFEFSTVEDIKLFIGARIVCETIYSIAFTETVIRCENQNAAALAYEKAVEPKFA